MINQILDGDIRDGLYAANAPTAANPFMTLVAVNGTTGSVYQATPADPGTTTSTTGVMMGLAGSITPSKSGKILIVISGDVECSVNNRGAAIQIRTGTGTAPTNGAALTGTAQGSLITFEQNNRNIRSPFSANCAIAGLSVGTTYWIDLSLAAIGSTTAQIRNISISVIEL